MFTFQLEINPVYNCEWWLSFVIENLQIVTKPCTPLQMYYSVIFFSNLIKLVVNLKQKLMKISFVVIAPSPNSIKKKGSLDMKESDLIEEVYSKGTEPKIRSGTVMGKSFATTFLPFYVESFSLKDLLYTRFGNLILNIETAFSFYNYF